jgi:hypothetical protein
MVVSTSFGERAKRILFKIEKAITVAILCPEYCIDNSISTSLTERGCDHLKGLGLLLYQTKNLQEKNKSSRF